jgi:mono/diheme cytochrome c family protein
MTMHVFRFLLLIMFISFFSLPGMGKASAESLQERGAYLVKGIGTCGNCHTPRGGPAKGKEMAGGNSFGGPKAPFTAYGSNITPDKETGIGNWTDAQIITAIREGKRPDGTTIGPPMPVELYRGISDNDAKAIVAYLRSLKPVKNKVKKSIFRFPLPKAYGPPVGKVADVPKSDPVKYGAYLAGPMGHCIECHTPQIKGRFDYKNQLGRGGRTFRGPWGVSVSSNLTPHPEDGLAKWTDAQIKRAITVGVRPDGTKLKPPMAYAMYKLVSDRDLNAIIAYLRSLKPMKSP